MIIIRETKLTEAADPKVQKMAYELFIYLTKRGSPTNPLDAALCQAHADQFCAGMSEFLKTIKDCLNGFMDQVARSERQNKMNYGLVTFDRVMNGIKSFFKYA